MLHLDLTLKASRRNFGPKQLNDVTTPSINLPLLTRKHEPHTQSLKGVPNLANRITNASLLSL